MRNLFIALGGSGGKTMLRLWERMNDEQRGEAKCLCLDTNRRDVNVLKSAGINAVRVSTADTAREIAYELSDDRLMDWLPSNNDSQGDRDFLDSEVDNGASQNRMKSRLCIARYLGDPGNELHQLLLSLMGPGKKLEDENVRVVIVSSIAGGTGAGSFMDVALYVRRFMRELEHESTRIIGIFGCPDLYKDINNKGDLESQTKKKRMYANAYAAIRELNAMNLATCGKSATTNDYGKNIKIRMDTGSEGCLFDSTDPEFTSTGKARPFDQLYFVDQASKDGGILSNVDHYYDIMADLAYVKLYSPMGDYLADLESNELEKHSQVPTAIYGGAGYARLIYPYEDILTYLAEQKTVEELGNSWRVFDDQWNYYCENERSRASLSGRVWVPQQGQRGEHYIKKVEAEVKKGGKSAFFFLPAMVEDDRRNNYADQYLQKISDEASCIVSIDSKEGVASMTDGAYSVTQDSKVKNALRGIMEAVNECGAFLQEKPADLITAMKDQNAKSAKNVASFVDGFVANVQDSWDLLSSHLENAVSVQASALALAILPTTEVAMKLQKEDPSSVNLRTVLLQQNGKDVHPLAARYFLYRVQNELRSLVDNFNDNLDNTLEANARKLENAFDPDPDDNKQWLLKDELDYINKSVFGTVKKAEDSTRIYMKRLSHCLSEVLAAANNAVKAGAYELVLKMVDRLVEEYEMFFDDLDRHQIRLNKKVNNDLGKHDQDEDQFIYVGASSLMKEYYRGLEVVKNAFGEGSMEQYAAAGAAIYDVLEKRARAGLNKSAASLYGKEEDEAANVFDRIVENYAACLRERCDYLKQNVMDVLAREVCYEEGLDESKYNRTPADKVKFMDAMHSKIADLEAKAAPMIRYDQQNREKYLKVEEKGDETDPKLYNVSTTYSFVGMSDAAKTSIEDYFEGSTPERQFNAFKKEMDVDLAVCNKDFSNFEIFCFRVVHCLQPTQIYRFHELKKGSYYEDYQKIVYSAAVNNNLSLSPHIDKRWHLKGCMPFISRELECRWRAELMKAFLHQILTRQIVFGRAEKTECFYRNGDNRQIQWPAGEPVVTRNISRLLEYLSEDEALVRSEAAAMDELVRACKAYISSNYGGSVATYKRGMTVDQLMVCMKTDALRYKNITQTGSTQGGQTEERASAETEDKVRKIRKALGEDEDYLKEDESSAAEAAGETQKRIRGVVDTDKTMGSVLRLAWLVKCSEEKLGEDRDYGEILLKVVSQIIDEIAKGMFGAEHESGSQWHKEYVDIYNHAINKFLLAYTEEAYLRNSWDVAKMIPAAEEDGFRYGKSEEEKGIKVPDALRNTAEYEWICKNLPYKKH